MSGLTHLDADGRARMVDVGGKAPTERRAVARCVVTMRAETLAMIADRRAPKGDVLAAARIAGIMAAKRTAELIPLCHTLPLSSVSVTLDPSGPSEPPSIGISATVSTNGRTGVEMEALTAASIAALTLYDMVKAVDRGMRVHDLRVVEKTGGASGAYHEG